MGDNIHVRAMTFNVGGDGIELRAAEDGDGLTLAGYIARFGQPTTIVDFLGEYTEELRPGAFTRTIAERGPGKVKMQLDHGHDALFGNLPVGVWTNLREDRKGLWGEGRILDTWHTIPLRAAIEAGAVDGMSFRFKVLREDWKKAAKPGELDHRTIREVALFEAGPVVFPAYEGTTVGVRSAALDLYRQALGVRMNDERATIDEQTAVAPVGDTVTDRSEADTPVGVTRRELRRMALHALRYTNEQASGDAA